MTLSPALDHRYLNLTLRDSTGAPLARRPYRLTLPDAPPLDGHTDDLGRLSAPIPAGTLHAELTIAWRRFHLRLDALEPVTTVAGAQARLNHLNFPAGPIDGDAGPRTRGAVAAFQRAVGLAATGELDPATAARLAERYEATAGGAP